MNESIKTRVIEWGKTNGAIAATAAQEVKALLSMITSNDASGSVGSKEAGVNMFQLYDAYAALGFVWENEGYDWRENMRIEDCAMVSMIAPYAYWYYSLTEATGDASQNAKEVKEAIENIQKLVKECSVKLSSEAVYQKFGSQWAGQRFTGTLKEIEYHDQFFMSGKWNPDFRGQWSDSVNAETVEGDFLEYALNHDKYRYNASRIYAGLGPKKVTESQINTPCDEAADMAMPEEWYKEMYDAYTTYTAGGTKRRTLLEILKGAGFKTQSGNEIETKEYKQNSYEQYLITNLHTYARILPFGEATRGYSLLIPVAIANTTGDIFGISDHEATATRYIGTYIYKYETHEYIDDDGIPHYQRIPVDKSADYKIFRKDYSFPLKNKRYFYYPEKAAAE